MSLPEPPIASSMPLRCSPSAPVTAPAGEVDRHPAAGARVVGDVVFAGAAVDLVVAGAADDHVFVAGAAVERVVALVALDQVVVARAAVDVCRCPVRLDQSEPSPPSMWSEPRRRDLVVAGRRRACRSRVRRRSCRRLLRRRSCRRRVRRRSCRCRRRRRSVSLPPSPWIVLSPAPATITSGALVPMIVAALETIVAGLPWQVGSPAPASRAPKAKQRHQRGNGASSANARRAGTRGRMAEGMISISAVDTPAYLKEMTA